MVNRTSLVHLDLGDLADQNKYRDPLDLQNLPTDDLVADYKTMRLIRRSEEVIGDLRTEKKIGGPVHLAIGQEAVATGVCRCLTSDDRLYGGHRSHSQYLALGGSLDDLFGEVLGKETGCSNGMGGSMHLTAEEVGFGGCVPIVAGTVPIAVGAALSFKTLGKPHVAVAFFGDGACEEGVVHESMNLAASLQLPVVFVVENNLFASHLDIEHRQAGNRTGRFAEAHGIDTKVVDGNDVCAVNRATAELVEAARSHNKPGFLEAVTYRWRGHVDADPNIDVGVRRSEAEVNAWKQRDPIARLQVSLESNRGVEPSVFEQIDADVEQQVEEAMQKGFSAPGPRASSTLDYVYAN